MGILSKNTIDTWIIPHLTVGSRGFDPTVPIYEIVEAILHRLKTGCQWRELPTKQFFSDAVLSWNTVFYHYNKWSKSGCWAKIWTVRRSDKYFKRESQIFRFIKC